MRTTKHVFIVCMFLVLLSGGWAQADVMPSSNPALVGQPVTFTVKIEVPIGVTATPTGTVTFTANGANLGAAPVERGSASFTSQFGVPGDQSIVAEYSGDANFRPVTSAPLVEHLTADDIFTVAVSPAMVAQSAGQTSSVQVELFSHGSPGTVRLSCEELPPGVQCSFRPDSVMPSTNGTGSTVAITSTSSRSAALPTGATMIAFACLMLPCFAGRRGLALLVLGAALSIPLIGCGGSARTVEVTPSGSYSVRVVATDGADTQTATIQFTVN